MTYSSSPSPKNTAVVTSSMLDSRRRVKKETNL